LENRIQRPGPIEKINLFKWIRDSRGGLLVVVKEGEPGGRPAHNTKPRGGISMKRLYYIGFDVHKKTIAYCVKDEAGRVVERGTIAANRASLGRWAESMDHLWIGAMEATLFTGWIYDFLKPYAMELKVAGKLGTPY
jgi:hypothetical protein